MSTEISKPGALMQAVHRAMRERHYSFRTETAYVSWIKRYVEFCGRKHPRDLDAPKLKLFLDNTTWLPSNLCLQLSKAR